MKYGFVCVKLGAISRQFPTLNAKRLFCDFRGLFFGMFFMFTISAYFLFVPFLLFSVFFAIFAHFVILNTVL